ncbi:MAG: transposase, partial [Bdellovibrionales bacterium]
MSRWLREVNLTCPIHITGRVNNREHFPLPLEEVWLILSESLYFLSKAFELQTISFVLMPNHFHLLATDAQGIMPKAMLWFMRETSREMGRRSGKI